jgi:leishmanolysin-like peptidase
VLDRDVGYYGGSVALADYCPYIQEFTWRSNNVVVRGSHCRYSENNPSKNECSHFVRNSNTKSLTFSASDRNFALELYGEKSMCFDHTEQVTFLLIFTIIQKMLKNWFDLDVVRAELSAG